MSHGIYRRLDALSTACLRVLASMKPTVLGPIISGFDVRERCCFSALSRVFTTCAEVSCGLARVKATANSRRSKSYHMTLVLIVDASLTAACAMCKAWKERDAVLEGQRALNPFHDQEPSRCATPNNAPSLRGAVSARPERPRTSVDHTVARRRDRRLDALPAALPATCYKQRYPGEQTGDDDCQPARHATAHTQSAPRVLLPDGEWRLCQVKRTKNITHRMCYPIGDPV